MARLQVRKARSKKYARKIETAMRNAVNVAVRESRLTAAVWHSLRGGVKGKKTGKHGVARTDDMLMLLKNAIRAYAIEGISAEKACKSALYHSSNDVKRYGKVVRELPMAERERAIEALQCA